MADIDPDDRWFREGPTRMLIGVGGTDGLGARWVRKNQPTACEQCRKRRTRCSAFDTGAPCLSCRKHEQSCRFGPDDVYPPSAQQQTVIFKQILPPPAPPCPSPDALAGVIEDGKLDTVALAERLKRSGTRPAPLVWKSADESDGSTPLRRHTAPRASAKRPLSRHDDQVEDVPITVSAPSLPKRLRTTRPSRKLTPVATASPSVEGKDGEALGIPGLFLGIATRFCTKLMPLSIASQRSTSTWYESRSSGMTQSSLPFSNRFALSAVRDDVEFRSLSDEL